MNSKLKTSSMIFMALVLVVGTISTIIPTTSFAQSYYPEYRESYSKDPYNKGLNTEYYNSYDDSYTNDRKDSKSVNVHKIKCNNINIIGTDLPSTSNGDMMNEITNDDDQTGQEEQWLGNNPYENADFNRNVVTICNNENNIIGVGDEEFDEIEQTCEECFLEALGPINLIQFENFLAGQPPTASNTLEEYCITLKTEIVNGASFELIESSVNNLLSAAGITLTPIELASLVVCIFEATGSSNE